MFGGGDIEANDGAIGELTDGKAMCTRIAIGKSKTIVYRPKVTQVFDLEPVDLTFIVDVRTEVRKKGGDGIGAAEQKRIADTGDIGKSDLTVEGDVTDLGAVYRDLHLVVRILVVATAAMHHRGQGARKWL